jgi:hypothetical protein
MRRPRPFLELLLGGPHFSGRIVSPDARLALNEAFNSTVSRLTTLKHDHMARGAHIHILRAGDGARNFLIHGP